MSRKVNFDVIVDTIKSILPSNKEFVPLHEPTFIGNEWTYVKECLDTGWVSSVGKFVDRFELELAEYTEAKYAIAVVNGTAALHTCLKLIGITENDEVIVPSLTFVATANAVTYCGAIPHFADIAFNTLGLDPVKLGYYLNDIAEIKYGSCYNKSTGRIIKAVVPMHTFGHPVDLDPLMEVCDKFKLELIEDAAEALGSYYKGRHLGNFGKLSSLSFNGNKIITTGGGGAILTNDESMAKMAKHITTTAKVTHKRLFSHDQIGYNYRLPNLNAALGCAQLEQLDHFVREKRRLAECYSKSLANLEEVKFFSESEFAQSNYWLNVMLLKEEDVNVRDELLERLSNSAIMARPAWTLMHHLPMYIKCPKMDLSNSEQIAKCLINLPSSVSLAPPSKNA